MQAKLAFALMPLIALPLLASGWLSWSYLGADLEREARQSLNTAVHLVERALGDLVDNAYSSLELLARAPETERYARATNVQDRYFLFQAPLLKLFQDYRRTYPEYLMIRFLLPDGQEDARAADLGFDEQSDDVPFEEPLPEYSTTVVPRLDTAHESLLFYRRIELPQQFSESADGGYSLRGYVALTVSLAGIYRQIAETRPMLGGWLLLVSADGQVLFAAGEEAADAKVPVVLLEQLGRLDRPDMQKTTVQPMTMRWGGFDWLLQVHPIDADLYAVAAMPAVALSGPLTDLALKILVMTLLSGVLLALVLYLSLRRLVLQPLELLRGAARAIGAGSLTPTIAVQSGDEIGLLADDVREMGHRLSTYRKQIEDLAFNDQLTGLPNRHLMRELLKTHLEGCQLADERLAVLLLDIDNFKQINDNLGHAIGDQLLKTLAKRVFQTLSADEQQGRSQVARFGGDELLVLVDRLLDDTEPNAVAEQILEATTKPFVLDDGHYVVTASIGVALFPRDAATADELIRCADLAMYRAKAVGRNTYRYFSPELHIKASERLLLEHRLRRAVGDRQLHIQYQPLFRIDGLQLAGFEALLRWTDPELGVITPTRFIPIAEQTGLIEEIGDWVLQEVCAQIARWDAAGLAVVPVAINISPVQLLRGSLIERVEACLNQFHLPPDYLHIEITESVLMDSSPINSARLKGLARLGIALHIDDFGTGYSSISYLRRFEVDCIKIDRSFVSDICSSHEDRALVTAMIAMAGALDVTVVAEGIETQEQLDLLRELGCDLGQGYLISRPCPVEEAERLLRETSASKPWQSPSLSNLATPRSPDP